MNDMKRLRIGLRNALLITALLAVALGWFVDRQRLEKRLATAEEAEKSLRRQLELAELRQDSLKLDHSRLRRHFPHLFSPAEQL
jgi:hypothetical protein